jgi:hypothetical protein
MVIRPCLTFPPPPLKFRTAGFPQYGFKRSLGDDLHRRFHTGLYVASAAAGLWVFIRSVRLRHPRLVRYKARPVALGSPGGCSVRPALCLLWPHPSFCRATGDLSIIRQPFLPQKFPNLLCYTLYAVPPSLRRWLQRLLRTSAFIAGLAFTYFVKVRQPRVFHAPDYAWVAFSALRLFA